MSVCAVILRLAALVFVFKLLGCALPNQQKVALAEFDAVVTKGECSQELCFSRIQDAIDSAPKNLTVAPYRILIEAGVYTEKVRIDTPNIHIVGKGYDSTQLVHALSAANARKFHRDNWGTPGSATLMINAADITIEGLHIENSFDYLSNDARPKNSPAKLKDSQAVAVFLDVDSDRVAFSKVRLDAYQDTLFAHGKRAYFRDSVITGNVDFIFGDGQVLFENSDIVSRVRGKTFKKGEIQGHVTAPSTQLSSKYGLVFLKCRLLREEGVPDESHSLGRPWHPTTTFSDGRYADPNAVGYAAYINTYMDAHIVAQGWGSMGGTARDGTKSLIFTPEESRFYELNSYGPGAPKAEFSVKRKLLESGESVEAIKSNLFDGWEPVNE